PPAEYAVSFEEIEKAVNESVKEAEQEGISGKEVTPYLLERVADKTSKRSIKANLELLKNNAKTAASIAIAYSHL
ncbi:MAG: pseudouridine-5'-phosphate glycosidase, partial [Anaerolineales bacterium]